MNADLRSMFIDSLTWGEVADALPRFETVLLPVGARCKEHGLHLPLNTDWIIAEHLARRIAELYPLLVLPTVQFGHYPAFVQYAGSVSIDEESFYGMIRGICQSFARHGIRRFFILNTGISTLGALGRAAEFFIQQGIRFEYTDPRKLAAAERLAVQQQSHGTHADELETSVMLHIAPQMVRMERARPELAADQPGPLTPAANSPGVYSPTGAWGDPTLATPEKGRRLVEAMVREIEQMLRA